jgi:hypothetical protein
MSSSRQLLETFTRGTTTAPLLSNYLYFPQKLVRCYLPSADSYYEEQWKSFAEQEQCENRPWGNRGGGMEAWDGDKLQGFIFFSSCLRRHVCLSSSLAILSRQCVMMQSWTGISRNYCVTFASHFSDQSSRINKIARLPIGCKSTRVCNRGRGAVDTSLLERCMPQ